MNKNQNTGVKSWKSDHEGHKTTASMIFENFYKYTVQQPPPVIIQVKNMQFNPPTKGNVIQRHYSEEDFKKFTKMHQHYQI